MTITRIDVGARMSKGVVHNGTLYTAGQVADAAAHGTVAEQTAEILSILDAIMAKAGTDKSKLLSVTIWLTDMATFAEMNAVWDAWVVPGATPGRATVETRLAAPNYKVEIAAVVAV